METHNHVLVRCGRVRKCGGQWGTSSDAVNVLYWYLTRPFEDIEKDFVPSDPVHAELYCILSNICSNRIFAYVPQSSAVPTQHMASAKQSNLKIFLFFDAEMTIFTSTI